jgi:EmrB/QacA subfamily drug resistance transporter
MRQEMKDPRAAYERRWLTLLVLCLSLMVIGLDNTILNVALPTLARPLALGGLGASGSELAWIVDAYTIVFAGLLLTAGSLGDRFGRYRGLTIGLAIFGTGSMLSALAPSASALIATRALMGIGGAFIMPATLSILTNVFTDPRERAKAIGIWAGVSALGIGVGPVAGGLLLEHFWWGSVFLVNAPVVVGALVLGYRFVPDSRDPSAPRLDPFGSVLSIGGLGALLWAIIEGPSHGWTSAPVLGAFAIGVVVLIGFMMWELRCSHPMLDVRFFENPRFSAASGAITLTFLALFGMIFLLTQYLQTVLGYSTVQAGALLIPMSAVMMVLAPMSTRWVHILGNKIVVAAGMGVLAVTLLLMTTFEVGSGWLHVTVVTIGLGVGMANIMAPATESIMGSLPRAKAGVGSAMNDTTRQVGGAIGVALLGSILSSRYASSVASGLHGKVPAALIGPAKDSVGSALGVARNASAARFAPQIISVAQHSFVAGLHVAVVVGAGVIVLGAIAVLRWLPARATDVPPVAPVGADDSVSVVPSDRMPVDVVPADIVSADRPRLADVGVTREPA